MRIAHVIVDEICPDLPIQQHVEYSIFEASNQHAITVEFSPPFGHESLYVGLRGLSDFLSKDKSIDYSLCHELIVENIVRVSDFAFLANDLQRMRILVQVANLFKLVGIRNWYKQILFEYDTYGVSLEGRRAPHTKLYTAVSYRLQTLHNGLSVDKRNLAKRSGRISIAVKSICAYNDDFPLPKIAAQNHLKYTGRHGYAYEMISNVPARFAENPQFYKIELLKNWLTSANTDEWLMLIDCDAFFTNHDTRIEDILNAYNAINSESHLLVAEDNGGINTGVLLVRRSLWALEFFRAAAQHTHMNMSWDQSMIFFEILVRSGLFSRGPVEYPPPGVQLVHQGNLNAFHEGTARSWNTYAWSEGDFVKHFAGCPAEESFCLNLMNSTVI